VISGKVLIARSGLANEVELGRNRQVTQRRLEIDALGVLHLGLGPQGIHVVAHAHQTLARPHGVLPEHHVLDRALVIEEVAEDVDPPVRIEDRLSSENGQKTSLDEPSALTTT
jgi:hypothetical protein